MKKTVKRSMCILLSLMFCFAPLSPAVYAATDNSRSYNFQLTVNGGTTAAVSVGDEITLEVKLERTDEGKSGSYAMYSMQDEIIYDSSYFSLVESSKMVTAGYDFNVRTMDDGIRKRVILSRMVLRDEGIETDDSVVIATFNLKTLQPGKDVSIKSKDYKVNSKTADTYITTANNVTVTISGPCTVTFDSNGGSSVESQTVNIGDKVTKPDDPVKTGYIFDGWYSDQELSRPWNFAIDCVAGNMTLYAKWTPTTPSTYAITFKGGPGAIGTAPTMGSKAYGESFTLPANTFTKAGYAFAGWNDGTNTYAAGSSYIMPAHAVTFTAQWTKSTGGGGTPGGGGGGTPDGGETLPEDPEGEPAVHTSPSEHYIDVDQSLWYHEAIDFVIENGLFVGTSETTFEPNTAMSRAMLVTVLWRLEGNPVISSSSTFKDVASGAWYTNAVIWASANKIVAGYGNGLFGPNDNITREQMAAILNRYAEFKGYDVTATDNLTAFTDAGSVSDWALSSVKWAVAEGLITGMTTTSLEPRGNASRAQVATILMRFIVNVAN